MITPAARYPRTIAASASGPGPCRRGRDGVTRRHSMRSSVNQTNATSSSAHNRRSIGWARSLLTVAVAARWRTTRAPASATTRARVAARKRRGWRARRRASSIGPAHRSRVAADHPHEDPPRPASPPRSGGGEIGWRDLRFQEQVSVARGDQKRVRRCRGAVAKARSEGDRHERRRHDEPLGSAWRGACGAQQLFDDDCAQSCGGGTAFIHDRLDANQT